MTTTTQLGGAFDRGANSRIGAAAADIARQRLINVGIRRLRDLRQQGRSRHDLSGLTVTALHHIKFGPGLLHRVRTVEGQALDGQDFLPVGHGRGRGNARTQRRAIDVHRAGTALGHATTELGAGQVRNITQDPEQRHVRGDIQLLILAVYIQGQHCEDPQTHGVLKGRRCGDLQPTRASGYPYS
jgi:hypothetical protein